MFETAADHLLAAILIEDDVYGDLYSGNGVRLAQIDALRHVIYIGSYTKLIGPALRVGFVAADLTLWRWFFFGLGLALVMLLRPEGLAGRRVRPPRAHDAAR